LATWTRQKYTPFDIGITAEIHVQVPESEHGSNAVLVLYDGLGGFDEVPGNVPIRRHKELNDRADIIYQKAVMLLETYENLGLLGK
jgi:hypothetical protein